MLNRVRRHVARLYRSSYAKVIVKYVKVSVHGNSSIKGGITVVSFRFLKLTPDGSWCHKYHWKALTVLFFELWKAQQGREKGPAPSFSDFGLNSSFRPPPVTILSGSWSSATHINYSKPFYLI
ncbi:hypothetical protein RchiOBHm_Chr4g0408301 [Rosa chinensis]|uniref:Uncharacterized protein n=1 Tax=Rosa chinensis TaxID=74649 RepID=A0A2P6QUT2_ROSCH|nr:hypothetical protein RchiOBHm_Chr4g0408301 [Rosa chinensis]